MDKFTNDNFKTVKEIQDEVLATIQDRSLTYEQQTFRLA